MATIVTDPNLRMVRAYANMGMHGGGHIPGGGMAGGGARSSANPLAALAAQSDEEPTRAWFAESSAEFQQRHAAWAAAQKLQAQLQLQQQHVRDAVGAFQDSYAQTGDTRQALAALMRHPGFYDLIGSGVLGKDPIKSLVTMGSISATGGQNGPNIVEVRPGMFASQNPKTGAWQLHNGPQPQKEPGKFYTDPEGKLQYGTASQVQEQGGLPQQTKPNPTQGKYLKDDTQFLSVAPQAYDALQTILAMKPGGVLGAIPREIAARYGGVNDRQTIYDTAISRLHVLADSGLLGSRFSGALKDFFAQLPKNVNAPTFNATLTNNIAQDLQTEARSRAAFAEQRGGPLNADVAQNLDTMGVKAQGGAHIRDRLMSDPGSLSTDELRTLVRAYGPTRLSPQESAALGAEIQKRSQTQTNPAQQAPAGGTSTLPSQAAQPSQEGAAQTQPTPVPPVADNTNAPPPTGIAAGPQGQPPASPAQSAQPPAQRTPQQQPAQPSQPAPTQPMTTNGAGALVPGGALRGPPLLLTPPTGSSVAASPEPQPREPLRADNPLAQALSAGGGLQ